MKRWAALAWFGGRQVARVAFCFVLVMMLGGAGPCAEEQTPPPVAATQEYANRLNPSPSDQVLSDAGREILSIIGIDDDDDGNADRTVENKGVTKADLIRCAGPVGYSAATASGPMASITVTWKAYQCLNESGHLINDYNRGLDALTDLSRER